MLNKKESLEGIFPFPLSKKSQERSFAMFLRAKKQVFTCLKSIYKNLQIFFKKLNANNRFPDQKYLFYNESLKDFFVWSLILYEKRSWENFHFSSLYKSVNCKKDKIDMFLSKKKYIYAPVVSHFTARAGCKVCVILNGFFLRSCEKW